MLATVRKGTDGTVIVRHQALYDAAGRVLKATNALQGVSSYAESLDGDGQTIKTITAPDGGTRFETYLQDGGTRTAGDPNRERSGGGVWCVSARGVVSNCVFTKNSADVYGGGAYFGTLNSCMFTGNSARQGGGAATSTLNNCALTGNSALFGGGGYLCTLNNCTLTGNSAYSTGGGTYSATLTNCIVYYNVAWQAPNHSSGAVNHSCTTPLPQDSVGNFTNAPLFVDRPNGNLRLQPNSPCINAGFNGSAATGLDSDGQPRVVAGTVDLGAYEFQSARSAISYAWLQQYRLPIDESTDHSDPDGDSFTNWQEWRAGTNPTNRQSVLRLLAPAPLGANLILTWQSVLGRSYSLEGSALLGTDVTFKPLATGLRASNSMTSFTHTNGVTTGPRLYRVRAE